MNPVKRILGDKWSRNYSGQKQIEEFRKTHSCKFGGKLGSCGCGPCSAYNAIVDAYRE